MSENTTVDQYLDELEIAKEDIKQAIERKGAVVSGGLSSYAGFIDTLETIDPRQQLPNGISFEGSTIDVFDLSPYDWSMVYDYSEMFRNCTNLTGFGDNLGNAFENMVACNNMFSDCDSLTTISQLDTSNVLDMRGMFYRCDSLTTIPLLDTSNVMNMKNLFYNCISLTSIPLLDTSNVMNMDNMFHICHSLSSVPQLDTSSVTSMKYMFGACISLTSIPLLDTSNVLDMTCMFSDCKSLTSVPQLDTGFVTNMNQMFSGCSSLTSIPQLDTSKVTDMGNMFGSCISLTSIPQLDTSKVTNMGNMFGYCYELTSIPLLDCSSVTVTTSPFGYSNLNNLTDIGGFKDLKVSWSSNFLDKVPNATVESLMNVINNLYDLTANGLSGKTLKFGTTNLNKLTTEQKAVATNKGWTLT